MAQLGITTKKENQEISPNFSYLACIKLNGGTNFVGDNNCRQSLIALEEKVGRSLVVKDGQLKKKTQGPTVSDTNEEGAAFSPFGITVQGTAGALWDLDSHVDNFLMWPIQLRR